ncbi:HypC/HybG/HupF family hydrogenase formation chaperone [Candidatus Woesearchaeota archaeon CG11_big_fil_rev_8_21_14_0_20_43_8]|nr:MAG: HypC/HybG/HupF family hydrogenase formation chaperone [Candidatus Woesearchaeota archaeon CG11_big_fil_rev_8_21_14_0_20_43_8]
MCLAVPGKIVSVADDMAVVDFGGAKKDICVSLVDARIGEYVLVHAGFAIKTISKDDAKKNLELLYELGELIPDDR